MLSSTVTTAVQVETFPLLSVTVSTTLFAPTLEQSKVFMSILVEAIPQASFEPPSTSAGVMVALPLASNCTVMFWQLAVGATLSSTVTTAVQVETLPLLSVTVSTTLFAPTLEQSKVVMSILVEAIPQASFEPPSTSAGVMVALPLASNCTVMF